MYSGFEKLSPVIKINIAGEQKESDEELDSDDSVRGVAGTALKQKLTHTPKSESKQDCNAKANAVCHYHNILLFAGS